MNSNERIAPPLSFWQAGTGEHRTTINGKDYTYGWFREAGTGCNVGNAWYCHTDNKFVTHCPAWHALSY